MTARNQLIPFNKLIIFTIVINITMISLIMIDFFDYNFPIVRQVVGFIYLTFFPGFLIFRLFKYRGQNDITVILFSIGLSISFLMFYGCAINYLYRMIGISNPFSVFPIFFGLFVLMFILLVFNYVLVDRNYPLDLPPTNAILKSNSTSILSNIKSFNCILIICLLVLLCIFGTYLVNYYNNNTLLFLFIFLISLIPTSFIRFMNKENQVNLYVIVYLITVSLLFHNSLISAYITGADIHYEYFFSKLVLINSSWNSSYTSNLNAMLTVVSLAPIYSLILNLDLIWVYKIVYPLLFSLVPLGLFHIYREQINEKIAFIGVFFYISVFPFYTEMVQLPRQQIAELFLILFMLLMIDHDLSRLKKSILTIIFILSLIVSHYGLSYLFILMSIFVIVVLYTNEKRFIPNITAELCPSLSRFTQCRLFQYDNKCSFLTSGIVIIAVVFALTWYMSFTQASCFKSIVVIGEHILENLAEIFNPTTSQSLGMIMHKFSFYHEITKVIHLISQLFIIVGFISISLTESKEDRISKTFLTFSLANLFLLSMSIVVPYFASALNTTRIYQITLSFLAIFFAIGAKIIFQHSYTKISSILKLNSHNSEKNSYYILSIFLCVYVLFNSGLVYELVGDEPVSISLNSTFDAPRFNQQEASSASWIIAHGNKSLIYSDVFSMWFLQDFIPINYGIKQLNLKFINNNSYLYLRKHNVDSRTISLITRENQIAKTKIVNLENISYYTQSSNIYENGGAEIMVKNAN